ncbi:MAG: restriction endonuclease, partial [Oscillospiraceae bacterium]|nr:restriction endonuclease [Oscillospiraceae bacterium]
RKAELERDIKSFISYAVGCMFGRYSLYKDGLIFAGEKYSLEKWVELNKFQNTISVEELNRAYRNEGITISELFFPGELPIIPITDDEYFSDDIVKRFVDFVETVYGKNTLEENLEFIANALKTKGDSPRRKIRNYFLGDFIKDHIKTYQKRPIYWLFDSGKQNGFKALVYIHRWDSNTIGNVRVEYLHKLQRIYESEIERMRETIDAADNSRDKANAEKRLDKLTKQLKETRDYDAKLSHLALESIDIDLDDGVKVNYEKVQTARDGKRLEILTPLK